MFSETYRPHHLNEIVGQEDVLLELRRWGDSWNTNSPAYKSAFLYGPPGCGKSSAANALSSDLSWDTLEIDDIDTIGENKKSRSVKEFRDLIENAVYNDSFHEINEHKNKVLIIIEDCDSYPSSFFKVMEDFIEKSVNPWVLLCNDEYAVKRLTPYFRESSFMLRFSPLKDYRIKGIALKVLKENNLDQPLLDQLIASSHGDLRYVLNNLQTKEVVPKRKEDIIFNVVHDIFRGNWNGDRFGIEPELIWYAVKANISNFYDTIGDMTTAEFVADIDLMFARHWRMMRNNPKEAFLHSQWIYIAGMLKQLPLHQKTAKIILPKSDIDRTINRDKLEFAHDMHCSYKKATSQENYMNQIYEIWRNAPKVIDNNTVKQITKSNSLFDFPSEKQQSPTVSRSTNGVGG